MENVQKKTNITAARTTARRAVTLRARAFAQAEDGALIIFGVFMFGLMLAIAGLSFDLMRYESNRSVLQATTDRAALAAASLTQSVDPTLVVEDYFAKAGLSDYLEQVIITDGYGSRKVEIDAKLYVPMHHGRFTVFGNQDAPRDTLVVDANSVAMEAIGHLEISMVLDVSGSMGSYNRLGNLKTASKNFIDTVYGASETGTVSTNIVPYSEQVTVGQTLLSNYTMDDSGHNRSFCVNFSAEDYNSVSLSTTTPLEQTLHFDPWTNDSNWDLGDPLYSLVCRTQTSRSIMAWEEDPETIKAHINSFYSGGNTSTDIGLKWGAALLDPGTDTVLSAMIGSGDVDPAMSGRPKPYGDGETMKIMVVMSDGENTRQHYMDDPYRTGDTAFYVYRDSNGVSKYSIWNGVGAPNFDPTPECAKYDSKKGKCKEWGDTAKDWYRVNDDQHAETPYSDGSSNPARMSWAELWAEFPVDEITDEILPSMGGQSAEIAAINAASKAHYGSTKNARMADICTAAKAAGVTIYAVALETNDNAASRLSSCASSTSSFFRVNGNQINFAFQAIASQINQLRLVH